MAGIPRKTQAQIDRLEEMVERLYQGLGWFLDPEPKEFPDAEPFPPLAEAEEEEGADEEEELALIELRRNQYGDGRLAHASGAARDTNPYRVKRGGYQRAWWLGWDDREAGVDRTPEADA